MRDKGPRLVTLLLASLAGPVMLASSAMADPPSGGDQREHGGHEEAGRAPAAHAPQPPQQGPARSPSPASRPASRQPEQPQAPPSHQAQPRREPSASQQPRPAQMQAPPSAPQAPARPQTKAYSSQHEPSRGPQGAPPVAPQAGPASQSPSGQLHVRMAPTPSPRPTGRPAPSAANSWSHEASGPARDVQGRNWRTSHQGLDQTSPWKQNKSWWRADPGFRSYGGLRAGFFFIPNIGYRSIPAGYEHRRWRIGQQAPRWFWQYSIANYAYYGLPSPPYGCMWIWLDRNIALIDGADGYIIDIVPGVW